MADPFLGQLMQVGFNFAPYGWAFAQGQLLPISQNTALFSLLGTTYGGNGSVTFGLPDTRSRVVVGWGQGPGLSSYVLGQLGGTEQVSILTSNLPSHTHPAQFTPSGGGSAALQATVGPTSQSNTPADGSLLTNPPNAGPNQVKIYAPAGSGGTTVNLGGLSVTGGGGTVVVGPTGSNIPISVLQPYIALNFIIALQGLFPSRN